ncbi:hypothetical protein QNI16_05835 [Cytophagaceae bacterium YF14B1]|uniref:Uncharacterized protein n=1 Tax=Xanthocytophaga flava TaxID=3048013 RepID=A0AAE3U4R9_9BACT|nr:hypothetical protein [Xanthocytophaga flavus]MDJ1479999.1 hypothetical protein [Xanthocytophaga flavus]
MVLSQVEDGVQIDLHYLIQMDNTLKKTKKQQTRTKMTQIR